VRCHVRLPCASLRCCPAVARRAVCRNHSRLSHTAAGGRHGEM